MHLLLKKGYQIYFFLEWSSFTLLRLCPVVFFGVCLIFLLIFCNLDKLGTLVYRILDCLGFHFFWINVRNAWVIVLGDCFWVCCSKVGAGHFLRHYETLYKILLVFHQYLGIFDFDFLFAAFISDLLIFNIAAFISDLFIGFVNKSLCSAVTVFGMFCNNCCCVFFACFKFFVKLLIVFVAFF